MNMDFGKEIDENKEKEFHDDITKNIELLDKLIKENTDKKAILKQWEESDLHKKIQQPPRFYYNPYLFKLQQNKVSEGKYEPIIEDFKNFDDLFRRNLVNMLEMMTRLSYLFSNEDAKKEQEEWIKVLKPLIE
jgi:ribosomal protein S6